MVNFSISYLVIYLRYFYIIGTIIYSLKFRIFISRFYFRFLVERRCTCISGKSRGTRIRYRFF